MLFLKSYPEEFQPVKCYPSRISTSRNIKFLKPCTFTLNLYFQSFQSDRANFLKSDFSWSVQDNELKFSGLSYLSYSNTVTDWQILIKFWDGSNASLVLQHLVGMTVEALKKKCHNFLATMAKRFAQWSKAKINSSFLAAIMENRFHKLSFYFIKIS